MVSPFGVRDLGPDRRDASHRSSSALVTLLYVSEISSSDSDVVEVIRRQSQIHNERDDITGLLLFDGWAFCQSVEGGAPEMANLLQRLQADRRHRNMRVLHFGSAEERSFSGWRLGFAYVADPKAIQQLLTINPREQLAAVRLLQREAGVSR
jgi:hypothetical protein